jgi:hypothetical protein
MRAQDQVEREEKLLLHRPRTGDVISQPVPVRQPETKRAQFTPGSSRSARGRNAVPSPPGRGRVRVRGKRWGKR